MNKKGRLIFFLLMGQLLVSVPLMANPLAVLFDDGTFYQNLLANGLTLLTILVVLGALLSMVGLLNTMVKVQQKNWYIERGLEPPETEPVVEREDVWSRLYKRLTRVVPVEKEEDILFDHAYDGIRELDNSLPPWWVYMFYVTIFFAVVYMTYYHFTDMGLSSREQYALEMEEAEERIQAYLARQASVVDETNVEMLTDDQALSLGETIYQANCAACHGMLGEGGVGPNLTDPYWIHGGSIKDVFRTIKYGVPEKGMISWQQQLRPADMHRVASFIMTLKGTDPPNGKEPQGELWEETGSDSTSVDQGAIGLLHELGQ